ncbi:MAG: hypothetical protein ABI442_11460 [Gemmatimonadaceae bacterium]
MTTPSVAHASAHLSDAPDGRRRQLRALLLSAADAARQDRRVREVASSVATPMRRAVRDRIATLLSAAE